MVAEGVPAFFRLSPVGLRWVVFGVRLHPVDMRPLGAGLETWLDVPPLGVAAHLARLDASPTVAADGFVVLPGSADRMALGLACLADEAGGICRDPASPGDGDISPDRAVAAGPPLSPGPPPIVVLPPSF